MRRTGKAIGTLAAATSLALMGSGVALAAPGGGSGGGGGGGGGDNSPPVVTPSVTGTLGSNGWYIGDVTVSWDVKDNQSAVSSILGCQTVTLAQDSKAATYTCAATSSGGTKSDSVTVKRDATKPTVTLSQVDASSYEGETPAPPTCTASDTTSGLADADAAAAGSQDCVVSGWSTAMGTHTVTAAAVDQAGNRNDTEEASHQVLDDSTAPSITPNQVGTSTDGWYTTDVAVSFAVSEIETPKSLLTGAGCVGGSVTQDTKGQDFSCSATSLGGDAGPEKVTIKRDTAVPSNVTLGSEGPQPGTTYILGSVPAAPVCTADDVTSGVARCEVTGYSDAVGMHTLTPTAVDNAGHSASGATRTYTVVSDTTPPVIISAVRGKTGENGWYVGDVTITWSVTDGESAVTSRDDCDEVTIAEDQAETTYTCSATSAGGTDSNSVKVKRDATAPVVSPDDIVNSTWRRTDLSQEFTASDDGSGLADPADATFTLTASDESSSTNAPTIDERTVTDEAGNSVTRSLSALVDRSGPTVTGADLSETAWRNTSLSADFTASDSRSGLADQTEANFTLSTSGDSRDATTPVTDSKTVRDAVGNSTTRTISAMVDTVTPTSTVAGVTAGAVYTTAPSVTCAASDALSGVATSGMPTGTGTAVGRYTVTCNGATDRAGNRQTVQSAAVSYVIAGLGQFSKNFDGSSVPKAKAGSTLPLGWAITDGAANYTLLSGATVASIAVTACTDEAGTTGTESAEVAAGSSGLQLLADKSYQINVKTSSTQVGCRRFTVTMTAASGSALTRSVQVQLMK